jgi:hypothetical protein
VNQELILRLSGGVIPKDTRNKAGWNDNEGGFLMRIDGLSFGLSFLRRGGYSFPLRKGGLRGLSASANPSECGYVENERNKKTTPSAPFIKGESFKNFPAFPVSSGTYG